MISLEKRDILTPLQKVPKNVGDLVNLIVQFDQYPNPRQFLFYPDFTLVLSIYYRSLGNVLMFVWSKWGLKQK